MMRPSVAAAVAVAMVVCAVCVVCEARPELITHETPEYTFEAYMGEFPLAASHFVTQGVDRRGVFAQRMQTIKDHNTRYAAGLETWTMGPNLHTALTDAEWSMVRGLRPELNTAAGKYATAYKAKAQSVDALPSSWDWRGKGIMTSVKNQGMCGSCWSFATAESLEAAWAIANPGQVQDLAEQQVLETPNPKQCGGTGGCQGGTAQLAFDYMVEAWNGSLASEWTYPYRSFFGDNFPPVPNTSQMKTPAVYISGYHQLPNNDQTALLEAVVNIGPVAISVDASKWHLYQSGVFTCTDCTDIDHAVVLVGYGSDPKLGDYYLVRNSWSPSFGESGYIRVARSSNPVCGEDTSPDDGFGCKDGPKKVTVCGTCGILSDSCIPIPKAAPKW